MKDSGDPKILVSAMQTANMPEFITTYNLSELRRYSDVHTELLSGIRPRDACNCALSNMKIRSSANSFEVFLTASEFEVKPNRKVALLALEQGMSTFSVPL